MSDSRAKRVTVWAIQILLAAFFPLVASGKLASKPQVVAMFQHWGFSEKFYLLIGTPELIGAIGLFLPRTAGCAAAGLIVIMVGAALTHLLSGEGLQVLRPLIFMFFLGIVVYVRRPWPLQG